MKLLSLRPGRRDLKFALGDLEATVLRRLWESGRPLSVKDFQEKVSRTHPIAVTTVATILDRLYKKGLVSRDLKREGGPHYLYRPVMSEEQFKLAVVDNVMTSLLRSFNDVTVAYLAEKMGVNEKDDRILSRYLNRLRRRAS